MIKASLPTCGVLINPPNPIDVNDFPAIKEMFMDISSVLYCRATGYFGHDRTLEA